MSAGQWKLTLAQVEPGNTASIPVEADGFGSTEPKWYENEQTLTFVYQDGRRVVWSWANLLCADYTPPTSARASLTPPSSAPGSGGWFSPMTTTGVDPTRLT